MRLFPLKLNKKQLTSDWHNKCNTNKQKLARIQTASARYTGTFQLQSEKREINVLQNLQHQTPFKLEIPNVSHIISTFTHYTVQNDSS